MSSPKQQVVDLAEAAGFLVEETGGGCTALIKVNPEHEDAYILITQLGDASVPVDPNQPVTVGWYVNSYPTRKPQSFADLPTALDAVAHLQ